MDRKSGDDSSVNPAPHLMRVCNASLSNYASVPANNNSKSRLMLSCAIYLLYFLAQH